MTLFTRTGCHLCEQAEADLRAAGIAFDPVDIESDDALLKRYLERIPVVAVDGVEISDFEVDVVALRHKLRER